MIQFLASTAAVSRENDRRGGLFLQSIQLTHLKCFDIYILIAPVIQGQYFEPSKSLVSQVGRKREYIVIEPVDLEVLDLRNP
jgi:hypothetical protein